MDYGDASNIMPTTERHCFVVLSVTTEQQCCLTQMYDANGWTLHLKGDD